MAGNSQKLNEGELSLYSMLISQGYVPVGVDLAARVFQVCYLTEKQKIKNKALSREAFLDFLKSPPFSQPLMVGFEACGGCNYWARFIESLGHKYKIMPAASIRAFLGLQKTDKIDEGYKIGHTGKPDRHLKIILVCSICFRKII